MKNSSVKTYELAGKILGSALNWPLRALILWLCWNGIFPDWVNVPALTYWRAFALTGVVMCLLPRKVASE